MTTATLTEAIYIGQGLKLHSNFLQFINTSGMRIVALMFGIMFMTVTIRYFCRYFPGNPGVPSTGLFSYVRIFFAAVLALGILNPKLAVNVSVKNFSAEDWAQNPRFQSVKGSSDEIKASALFYLLGGSANEISRLIETNIDHFAGKQAQTRNPNEAIRLVVNASLAQIEGNDLRAKGHLLFDECSDIEGVQLLRLTAKPSRAQIGKLSDVTFTTNQGTEYDCWSLLQEVRTGVSLEAQKINPKLHARASTRVHATPHKAVVIKDMGVIENAMLVNLLNTRKAKVDLVPDAGGGFFAIATDSIQRFFTFGKDFKANEAARKKALEYQSAERLAPHFIGFVKMMLIALFPFLVFPLVMGYWRIMALWSLAFLSVCMWSPIWTLMHHCFVEVSQMAKYLSEAQYSALMQNQMSSEIVSMYIVFVTLQLAVAPAFSFFFISSLKPLLANTAATVASQKPVREILQTGAGVASALAFTMPALKLTSKMASSAGKISSAGSIGASAKKVELLLPGTHAFGQTRAALPKNLRMSPKRVN
jgi:hypothetical protein